MIPRVFQFLVVGGSAFLLDAVALWLLWRELGLHPLLCRVLSMGMALVYTYNLNRLITFRDRSVSIGTFPAYVAASLLGICVNFAVYTFVLRFFPTEWGPMLGAAAGTLAGMILNFSLYNWAVFGGR